jgi:hypothetical protein
MASGSNASYDQGVGGTADMDTDVSEYL